jgi:outer membrane lipoprotein carrier protein
MSFSLLKMNWRQRSAGLLISFFILFIWDGVSAQEQNSGDLDAILSQLKDRFATSKTFQADYLREIVPKIASKLPSSSMQAEGQLSFHSPNKLRMDQKKPRLEQFICNGKKVWWYLPEEKVVNIYQLKDYYLQIKPIVEFFSGLGRLDKNFSIRLDPSTAQEATVYGLILQPKSPQPDLKQIFLKISKETFLPVEFSFFNMIGDGTLFRFSRVQTDAELSETFFEFTPPKGTQVVSQPPVLLPKK